MDSTSPYLRYTDDVEVFRPDEEKTFGEIAALMGRLGALMFDRYRHATRSVHAKSHGILRGDLTVYDGLPAELKQGLFAAPATFPTILRFSTNPGDILADSVSTPRGLAWKVIGADAAGPMLPEHRGQVTQDFVFAAGKVFAAPDAEHFLALQKQIELNANDPELFKKTVSAGALAVNKVLGTIGLKSSALEQLGYPHTHILGDTFGSQCAIRYGDHVAKVVVAPLSPNLTALTDKHLAVAFHYSALKDAIEEFFRAETAEWEVRVQLCTDLKTMPVEDPTVEWPEAASPYRGVAKIVARPQASYGPARRVFADENLSFNPFHSLAAHRPLGNIMRARRKSYAVSADYRHEMNGHRPIEPKSIAEMSA